MSQNIENMQLKMVSCKSDIFLDWGTIPTIFVDLVESYFQISTNINSRRCVQKLKTKYTNLNIQENAIVYKTSTFYAHGNI